MSMCVNEHMLKITKYTAAINVCDDIRFLCEFAGNIADLGSRVQLEIAKIDRFHVYLATEITTEVYPFVFQ